LAGKTQKSLEVLKKSKGCQPIKFEIKHEGNSRSLSKEKRTENGNLVNSDLSSFTALSQMSCKESAQRFDRVGLLKKLGNLEDKISIEEVKNYFILDGPEKKGYWTQGIRLLVSGGEDLFIN